MLRCIRHRQYVAKTCCAFYSRSLSAFHAAAAAAADVTFVDTVLFCGDRRALSGSRTKALEPASHGSSTTFLVSTNA